MELNKCRIHIPSLVNKTLYQYDIGIEGVTLISSLSLEKKHVKIPAIRIHSSCLLSERFGTMDCDCNEQLKSAVWYISNVEDGIIFHLNQEGRGHGNSKKIKILDLMDKKNIDTVAACTELDIPVDVRKYVSVIKILKCFNIRSVRLISNNPLKEKALLEGGVHVHKKIRLPSIEHKENKNYLKSKRDKLQHDLILQEAKVQASDDGICFFHPDDEMGFLSNLSKHPINIEKINWHSVEHFYKSHKYLDITINNDVDLNQLQETEHKKAARTDWEKIKIAVMYTAIYTKFTQHPNLKEKLLSTGDALIIEKSERDYFWGCGKNQSGQNYLGKLLMTLRSHMSH